MWNTVDITMAIMTLTNLVALIWLARWGVGHSGTGTPSARRDESRPCSAVWATPTCPATSPVTSGPARRTHLDEAGGTADDGVPAATPASSQPAASTGADA